MCLLWFLKLYDFFIDNFVLFFVNNVFMILQKGNFLVDFYYFDKDYVVGI